MVEVEEVELGKVDVDVASQEAHSDVVTQADWPPDPAQIREVVLLAHVEPEGLDGPAVPVRDRVGNAPVSIEDAVVTEASVEGMVLDVCEEIAVLEFGEKLGKAVGKTDSSTRGGRLSQDGVAIPSDSYDACALYAVAMASGQALAEGVVMLDLVAGSILHPVLVTQLVV